MCYKLAMRAMLLMALLWAGTFPSWAEEAENTQTYTYVFTEPLESRQTIGTLGRAIHWVAEPAFQLSKCIALYAVTGEIYSPLILGIAEAAKTPAIMTAQSIIDLNVRRWWQNRKKRRDFEEIPHLERVAILSASEVVYQGILAVDQLSTGVVFVKTTAPLEENKIIGDFPPLQRIYNLDEAQIHMNLFLGGEVTQTVWTPSVRALWEGTPLPEEVALSWRQQVMDAKAAKKKEKDKDLEWIKLNASLVTSNGDVLPIGTLARSSAAEKIVGTTWLQRQNRKLFGKNAGWITAWMPAGMKKRYRAALSPQQILPREGATRCQESLVNE